MWVALNKCSKGEVEKSASPIFILIQTTHVALKKPKENERSEFYFTNQFRTIKSENKCKKNMPFLIIMFVLNHAPVRIIDSIA